jgi:hypothetical protein
MRLLQEEESLRDATEAQRTEMLWNLPRKSAETLALRLAGKYHEEIGQILGVTRIAITRRLKRAVASLRWLMGPRQRFQPWELERDLLAAGMAEDEVGILSMFWETTSVCKAARASGVETPDAYRLLHRLTDKELPRLASALGHTALGPRMRLYVAAFAELWQWVGEKLSSRDRRPKGMRK